MSEQSSVKAVINPDVNPALLKIEKNEPAKPENPLLSKQAEEIRFAKSKEDEEVQRKAKEAEQMIADGKIRKNEKNRLRGKVGFG